MAEKNELNLVDSAAKLAREPIHTLIEDVPYVFVPDDWNVESFEQLLSAPRRIKEKPVFNEPESFQGYINEFHNLSRTRYFADFDKYTVTGILNASTPDSPQHSDHRAILKLEKAQEWLAWTNFAGKQMSGKEFARFLENHVDEISGSIDGNMLLMMCRGLRVRTNAETDVDEEITEGTRKLKFAENTKVTGVAGSSEFAFPEKMDVTLRIFQHMSTYRFTARLRWDKHDSKGIVFFYDLVDQTLIEQEAFKAVRKELESDMAISIYVGTLA